ncbi:MAG: hypothetical protein U0228_20310 [Myxococcaceae bacterium]
MRALLSAVVLVLAASACRTEIQPLVKQEPVAKKVRNSASGECTVNDYPAATDLPTGAQNIGWVKVPRQATDDETFALLRKEVCAKGGDAMSQLHWLRAPGASVADPPAELEANVWVTP